MSPPRGVTGSGGVSAMPAPRAARGADPHDGKHHRKKGGSGKAERRKSVAQSLNKMMSAPIRAETEWPWWDWAARKVRYVRAFLLAACGVDQSRRRSTAVRRARAQKLKRNVGFVVDDIALVLTGSALSVVFGRPELDVGTFLAHLHLAGQPKEIIERWRPAYEAPSGFDDLLMTQLAGVEIMRRLIGYAQLPLSHGLEEKRRLLELARAMVLQPGGGQADFRPSQHTPTTE